MVRLVHVKGLDRVVTRLFTFMAAVVGLVIVGCRSAEALDPARTLTQYVHRIWQVQQGLPQASVYAIVQTGDGRLWLGTQTGLVRFDGVRFTSIDEMNGISLADVWVTRLIEDHDRALWIGTDQSGVFKLSNGVLTHYSTQDGLPADAVQCLFEGRDGRVWVCTTRGLATWNGKEFRAFEPPAGRTIRNVRATCETPDGHLWIAHDDHDLDVAAGQSNEAGAGGARPERLGVGPQAVSMQAQALPAGAQVTIHAMLCSASTGVWIGTEGGGVFHLTDGLVTRVTTADGLADNRVLSLAESRDGSVLVGTTNGFSRIRGPEVESFTPKDGLSQSAVYALYEDHEQTLWAATGHGLNQFLDGRATPYTTSEGLPSNDTGPVLQDRTGTTWVGTLGAGLARFDGHDFYALTMREGLASNTVRALAADESGNLWVGTDRGLNRILHGRVSGVFTTRNGLPSDAISALMVDSSGGLWIATSHGAVRYDHGKIEPIAGTTAPIVALGEDGQHHVYLAPKGAALLEYSNGALKAVADPTATGAGSTQSLATGLMNVDAMYTDPAGLMWVGTTGGGLSVIDRGRVSRFSVRDGLFDDSIYGIVGDNRDRLWMACSKGIFSVERSQLLRFAARQTGAPNAVSRVGVETAKIVSTPYSPTDVLRTIECKSGIQPAAWGTANGQLWFSTVRGLLLLDSKNVDRRFAPPPAAIDEITVNGEPTKLTTDLGRLRPDLNNVAFRYTGLSFIVPTRITFRYQLEGFDKKWVDAGPRREAFYTNLLPGRYRFQVEACNLEGECRGTSAPVGFVIEPRYYQRAWFIPACVLGAIFAGLAGYRLRIQRLRAQFEVVLAERNRIARELHDTLIQGFSGITMAMQALAARLPAGDNRQTLEQIVTDAGSSLTEVRRSLFGLRSGHAVGSGLAEAIEQSARQLTEAKDIRLKLKLDEDETSLPAEVEYHLLRIAQEAVLNAVKHSDARSLLVALERTATRVRLLVKDDGSGFDGTEEPRPGHFGVVGMHERAAQIGTNLHLESAPGTGTTVSVTIRK